jgi:CRP-like cAMP-binding protein
MQFLQTIPQFAVFSQSELVAFEKAFRVDSFPDGHVFMNEGDHADAMYLILEGEVEVRRRRKNTAGYALIDRKRSGEIVGLISLINNEKHGATAVAVGAVQVASLPQSAFELLFDTHAPIALHFQRLVARQLARDLRRFNRALRAAVGSDEVGATVTTFGSD